MPSSCIGEAVVRRGGRERTAGHQVVLVGRVHQPVTEHGREDVLPVVDRVDDRRRLGDGVQPHRRLGVELRQAQRDDGHRRQVGEAVEDPGHRVVEHGAVVDAGTHDDLTTHLDPVVEQRPQPAQAHPAPRVAQHAAADLGIGGVDAHVERRQPLGHDPLEVGLGEAGQRREVAVQEAQPVVVVLEVEAPAHPLRQLVDEAELAVVVARADPVEHRALHLDAERLAVALRDVDDQLDPAAHERRARARPRRSAASTR